MKALVYTGVEELVYREEKDPVETSGESILKVHVSGIGSDMHAYLKRRTKNCTTNNWT